MCTVLLPPGVNPIPGNKYIDIDIRFRVRNFCIFLLKMAPPSHPKLCKLQTAKYLDPPLFVKLQLQWFVIIHTIIYPFFGTELTKRVIYKQMHGFLTFHGDREKNYVMSLFVIHTSL